MTSSSIAGVAGSLDNADWVGAWAPGGGERVMADDIGIPLKAGTQLVVQMHYNLSTITAEDATAIDLEFDPEYRLRHVSLQEPDGDRTDIAFRDHVIEKDGR